MMDDTRIFLDDDGRPFKSFTRGFSALLKETNLHIDPEFKSARDSYCLCHYYTTDRLLDGVGNYIFAEIVGTNIQITERNYGHVKSEMASAELTKTNDH
jgi:hypothetical protein